jgi:hypothetical protein
MSAVKYGSCVRIDRRSLSYVTLNENSRTPPGFFAVAITVSCVPRVTAIVCVTDVAIGFSACLNF